MGEFEVRDVAEIVAQTMNNYFIMKNKIVVQLMDREKVPQGLFKHCNTHMKDTTKLRKATAMEQHNKGGASTAMAQRNAQSTRKPSLSRRPRKPSLSRRLRKPSLRRRQRKRRKR